MLRSSLMLFIVASLFTFKVSSDELSIVNFGESSTCHENKCPEGPRGPQGFNGLNGLNGAPGATGVAAPGFVIPYTSGRFISELAPVVSTLSDGTPGFGVLVAFGTAAQTATVVGADINLSTFGSYSYTMPRDGTLTSISATFSAEEVALISGFTVSVHAQIWTTGPGSNLFTPLSGATVNLSPFYSGAIIPSKVSDGIVTGLNIPIAAQTRVMLLFYADAAGFNPDLSATLKGSISASIAIE